MKLIASAITSLIFSLHESSILICL